MLKVRSVRGAKSDKRGWGVWRVVKSDVNGRRGLKQINIGGGGLNQMLKVGWVGLNQELKFVGD